MTVNKDNLKIDLTYNLFKHKINVKNIRFIMVIIRNK